MKKFIAIMVMLLIGLVANAQLSYRDGSYTVRKFVENDFNRGIKAHYETSEVNGWFVEFKLGEYSFVGSIPKFSTDNNRPSVLGGSLESMYKDEPKLWEFIRQNKAKIEKKFGVTIVSIAPPYLTVYDAEDYQRLMEAKENFEKMAEEAKQSRINSLDDIL